MIGPVIFPRKSFEGAYARSRDADSPLLRILKGGRVRHPVQCQSFGIQGASEKCNPQQGDPGTRPDSDSIVRRAADRRHEGSPHCDSRHENRIEEPGHDAMLLRIGPSRDESRCRRENKSVSNPEQRHQDKQARQVPDQRD